MGRARHGALPLNRTDEQLPANQPKRQTLRRAAFHDVLEDGDAIVLRFTMTGRHEAEFLGVPATGTDIALPGITILRFAGDTGQVVERWSNADMLGLLVQLGAVPAPA